MKFLVKNSRIDRECLILKTGTAVCYQGIGGSCEGGVELLGANIDIFRQSILGSFCPILK